MRLLHLHLTAVVLVSLGSAVWASPRDVVIDDRNVFPESFSATSDGTIYIGSNLGRIYRAMPGQAYAEPWLLPENTGLHHGLRGVLADKTSNTLWICDNDGKESSLVRFALSSGKKLANYAFPGGGHCNDISLKAGAAYVTDTGNGRILKLAAGAQTLSEWYKQDDPSLDGLVWARDGKLYTNTYSTHHLIRVAVNPDGTAGKGTVLSTSEPLYQPDGMRLSPDGRVLLAEGRGRPDAPLKDGRIDEVRFEGDRAVIKVLKTGFELPTAVTASGRTVWVLESKFDYLRNPVVKGKDPGHFHIYGVALPSKQ